jgi:preprotein translocase subunit SecD
VAPPAGTLRVGRYFLALGVIFVVLYTIVFWPGTRHTPHLGIDLAGGQQVIFTAKSPNGKPPTKGQMEEARQILSDRVNGTGVTEATVVIQGKDQLVVSIPGDQSKDIQQLGKAAQLNLRGLVMPAIPIACTAPAAAGSGATSTPSPAASPAGASGSGATPKDAGARPLSAASTTPTTKPKASASPKAAATPKTTPKASATPAAASPTPTGTATATAPTCTSDPLKGLSFTVPQTEAQFNALTAAQQTELKTALSKFDCTTLSDQPDTKEIKTFIACDPANQYAYLLGPIIVPGTEISSASAQAPNPSQGQTAWTVALNFKSSGQTAWAKYTSAHNIGSTTANSDPASLCGETMAASGGTGTPCADFVSFTLDGQAISVPVNQEAINGGNTQITGGFNQSSANTLAKQLRYGALPLSFTASQAEQVSPTLGSSQLKAGMLAGGIGLILVVVYSLMYYRALGLVTIASLIVSGGLTYGALVVLGSQMNFTLSLAGIAGFIVAIGITADSFVVFFERIKDEVHGGRSMRVAVPRAWVRARRTILSADTVSFLAAAILYYFAAGDVKGFAFTLGLSTILDLVVVFLFTHPLISLLSRSRAFGSARFTGLNAVREGGIAVDTEEHRVARPSRAVRERAVGAEPVSERFAGVTVMDRPEPSADGVPAPEADATAPDVTGEDQRGRAPKRRAARREAEATAAPIDEQPPDEQPPDELPQDEPVQPDEPAERRRTTPAAGSAAERAAARRARMRGKTDAAGETPDGDR